jgi:hypothetical protein
MSASHDDNDDVKTLQRVWRNSHIEFGVLVIYSIYLIHYASEESS